jgi:hypothetical protein
MIARHKVTRLNTKSQEIPSAINVGDWEKRVAGCQLANCKLIGNCPCHINTLNQAEKAPPPANSQLYRKPGIMIRSTTRVRAVNNRIKNVNRMDMQRQFYQVCPLAFSQTE